jgi:cytochrome c5
MKKRVSLIAVVFVASLITLSLLMPSQAFCQSGKTSTPGKAIPDSLYKIFSTSCMKCHSTGGSAFATSHVNFSDWNKYDAKKQASKAADICKELTKGSMPPKSYRSANPSLIPTAKQTTEICNWATSLGTIK